MNKSKLTICLILNFFLYFSCYGRGNMGFATRDKMTLLAGENIIKCISEKNSKDLKKLFSVEVQESVENLDEQIQHLFNYCDGTISNFKKDTFGMECQIDNGKNYTLYYVKYSFILNDISYMLYYTYTPQNTFDSKKEGVEVLKVVKQSEIQKYFCYWNEIKPGITVCDY